MVLLVGTTDMFFFDHHHHLFFLSTAMEFFSLFYSNLLSVNPSSYGFYCSLRINIKIDMHQGNFTA